MRQVGWEAGKLWSRKAGRLGCFKTNKLGDMKAWKLKCYKVQSLTSVKTFRQFDVLISRGFYLPS